MTLLTYNLSLLIGLLLTAIGIGLWNVAAGLAAGGLLLIVLTIFNFMLFARAKGR